LTDLTAKPLVSVVIPVYNGANYLSQAIDSALAQTWPNLEVIVVDDGSDDNGHTDAVALSYGDRIRYLRKPNGGVATALNYGVEAMRSEYLSWLSHDDVFEPNKIDRMMRVILGRPDTVVTFGDFVSIDADGALGREHRAGDGFDERQPLWALFEGRINGCALIVPKRCFDICGRFDPRLPATQDYDMWFRVALQFPLVHVPGIAVFQRHHPGQGSKSERFAEEVQLLWMSMLDRLPRDVILAHAPSKAAFFERVSRWVLHMRGVCLNLLERMHSDVQAPVAAIVLRAASSGDALARALKLHEHGVFHTLFPRSESDPWRTISVEHDDGSRTIVEAKEVPSATSAVATIGTLAASVNESFVWVTTGVHRENTAIVSSQVALLTDDPSAVACLVTDTQQGSHSKELDLLEGAVLRVDALRAACQQPTVTIPSFVHALSRFGSLISKVVPRTAFLALEGSAGEDSPEQFAAPARGRASGLGTQAWAWLNRWPRAATAVTRTIWSLTGGSEKASQRLLDWNGLGGTVDGNWYRSRYEDVAASGIDPVLHYLLHGYRDGRDPAPNFSTRLYLADNPDVERLGLHPLQHFLLWGHKEGRRVQPAVEMPARLPDSAADGRAAILILLHGGSDPARLFARDLSRQVARRLRPIVLTVTNPDVGVLRSFEPDSVGRPFVLSQALDYLARESARWDLRRVAVLHDGVSLDRSVRGLLERLQCPFDLVHLDYGLVSGNPGLTDECGRFVGEAQLPGATWRDDPERRWLIERAAEHFACSRSLADRLARFGVARDIVVAPPPDPFRLRSYRVWARPMDLEQPLRIALFGSLTQGEGREVVAEVLRRVARRKLMLRFRLYGQADASLESAGIFESVRSSSLVDDVCSWHPHLAWFPLQSPDECGYTLRAAESMGLPIAASSLGMATERLASRRLSWLLPWNSDPDRWIELFERLHREGMADANCEDRIPAALPDDHALYQRFYWSVACGLGRNV
jgi:glycosyltransferase involved in cell wall biosynthesis